MTTINYNGILRALLVDLADARREVARCKAVCDEHEKELDKVDAWKKYKDASAVFSAAKRDEKAIYEVLREAALESYEATKQKQYPGVVVQLHTAIEIEDRDAFYAWAITEARYLIPPDEKKLLKHAQADPVPGVKVVKVPQARVDSDLSEFESKEEA